MDDIYPVNRLTCPLSPSAPLPSYRVISSSTTMSAKLLWIRLSILCRQVDQRETTPAAHFKSDSSGYSAGSAHEMQTYLFPQTVVVFEQVVHFVGLLLLLRHLRVLARQSEVRQDADHDLGEAVGQ